MDENEGEATEEEAPASSSNVPSETPTERRSTRRDAVPLEEHLTEEDWAIMAAVERCPVWRSLKSLNLRQREKLLAAVCMVIQETVEGTADRTTVNCPDDFRNWGRRRGEDDSSAQLVMQNQWDNILRHVMGITAAMEVWDPSTSSSSTTGVAPVTGDNNTNASALDGDEDGDDHREIHEAEVRMSSLATQRK